MSENKITIKNVTIIEVGSFGLNLKHVRMLRSKKYKFTFYFISFRIEIGNHAKLNFFVKILLVNVHYSVMRTPKRHPNFMFLVRLLTWKLELFVLARMSFLVANECLVLIMLVSFLLAFRT